MKKYPKTFKTGRYRSFWYRDADGRRHAKSTGCERVNDADDFVRKFIDARTGGTSNYSFAQYQVPFYNPTTCPHAKRLGARRRHIGLTWMTKCRQWIDKWIVPADLPGPVADGENLRAAKEIRRIVQKPVNQITPGDLWDLRGHLQLRVLAESKRIKGEGLATVNNTMTAVGTIFHEAALRRDIPYNPADELGRIDYDQEEKDVLTVAEIRQLFDHAWTVPQRAYPHTEVPDQLGRDVMEFSYLSGMRCSEVLKMVPAAQLQGDVLTVDRAFKGREEGKPKHEKTRWFVLCARALEIARRYPNGFRQVDGSRLGETWWREHFASGLACAEIEARGRHFTPHCLRHSLNTHLLDADVDPMRIQLQLWGRRADPQAAQGTTNRITKIQARYMHLQAEMTRPVALAIDRIRGTSTADAAASAD